MTAEKGPGITAAAGTAIGAGTGTGAGADTDTATATPTTTGTTTGTGTGAGDAGDRGRTATFLIYLDACRYDYITRERTPFLHSLGERGSIRRARTVCGFTQESAMLTGKYPVETGHFTWFHLSENSPFAWLRPFCFLSFLPQFKLYEPVKVLIRKTTSLITGRAYPDPAHIPLDLLPRFERVDGDEIGGISIDSICRSSGRRAINLMNNNNFVGMKTCSAMFEAAATALEREVFDLCMIHIGELDVDGHKLGPRADLLGGHLATIDACLSRLHRAARRLGISCNMVIVSDHGMQPVAGTVDVIGRVKEAASRAGLRSPRDYLYFLDSTMARFWFPNGAARRPIEEALSAVPHGHIVTEGEKEERGINFRHNLYGDTLFWLDKGYIVFPNFFQSTYSDCPRGMHGYMDDDDGLLVLYSDSDSGAEAYRRNQKDPVPLVDIFSIVLDMMGVGPAERLGAGPSRRGGQPRQGSGRNRLEGPTI